MIDWLLQQSIILSFIIALLVIAHKPLNQFLGAATTYRLWLLVPTSLVFSLVSTSLTQTNTHLLQQYQVVANQQAPLLQKIQSIQLADYLMWIWLSVAFFLALAVIFLHHVYRAHLQLKHACNYKELTIPSSLALQQSDAIHSPLLLGLIKPTLVIPSTWQERFDAEQRQLIIKHELTHYHHGDLVWNFVAMTIVIACWFNPVVWVGYRFFRQQQELACDHQVLKQESIVVRKSYAQAMISASLTSDTTFITQLNYSEKNLMKMRIKAANQHKNVGWVAGALFAAGTTVALAGAQLAIAGEHNHQVTDKVWPTHRIEPVYPQSAKQNKVEGSVTLSFSIEANGAVSDISITNSEPAGVFDKSASDALAKWKYKPMQNKVTGLLVQLDYVLDADYSAEQRYQGTEIIPIFGQHQK